MIITKEKWNTVTCREVFELMREYNKTAPDEMKFFFADEAWRRGRLVQGGYTSLLFEQDFMSDDLWVNHKGNYCINPDTFMTHVEYCQVHNLDPSKPIIF